MLRAKFSKTTILGFQNRQLSSVADLRDGKNMPKTNILLECFASDQLSVLLFLISNQTVTLVETKSIVIPTPKSQAQKTISSKPGTLLQITHSIHCSAI
jgi:hypothetical protein